MRFAGNVVRLRIFVRILFSFRLNNFVGLPSLVTANPSTDSHDRWEKFLYYVTSGSFFGTYLKCLHFFTVDNQKFVFGDSFSQAHIAAFVGKWKTRGCDKR